MQSTSEKYEQKKRQIIEAAEELFAYYGYDKTTLDDIAKKVAIKKNSLYYYFESKEELLDAIVNLVYNAKVEKFEKESSKAKNSLEKLKLFLSVLISKDGGDNNEYKLTPDAFLEISLLIEKSFKRFYKEAELILTEVLRDGIKCGELRKHSPQKIAKIIIDFTRALELFELSRSKKKFIDDNIERKLKQQVMQFADLIYTGIKK